MKKILSLVLLGALLFSFSGALAEGIPSGGGSGNECCAISHELDKFPGDTNTTATLKGAIVGPSTTAECDLGTVNYESKTSWAAYCTVDTIYTVTDWIFWVTFIIGGVVIIIGGIMIMVSGGNPERAKSARAILTYGVIGIVVAVVAKLIPALARFFVGM